MSNPRTETFTWTRGWENTFTSTITQALMCTFVTGATGFTVLLNKMETLG